MKKYFIITVDTEGDNLWNYKDGEKVDTVNAHYIPPFQSLCEKYSFKPVYLINYEMALDDFFISKAKRWQEEDTCEIGIHLHAWNNPPYVELKKKYCGNPYLIEYSHNDRKAKFDFLYNLLIDRFGTRPVSHRAGRWAMDDDYFDLLKEYDVKVDCSHTPYIDWSNNLGSIRGGSDYSNVTHSVSNIRGILEVPLTVRQRRFVAEGSIKHRIRALLKKETILLRPATQSLKSMIWLVKTVSKETETDYIELMLHSSELMPGGSPYFADDNSILELYSKLDSLFKYIQSLGYQGLTLKEYSELK